MPYATPDDMIRHLGEADVIALTDREMSGQIDAAVLNDALEMASAEIDTYLASRYELPLTAIPKYLASVCCDVARYRLSGNSGTLQTTIAVERYRDAIAFLKLAADGKITLGATAQGMPIQAHNTIEFVAGTRVFSSRDRGAY